VRNRRASSHRLTGYRRRRRGGSVSSRPSVPSCATSAGVRGRGRLHGSVSAVGVAIGERIVPASARIRAAVKLRSPPARPPTTVVAVPRARPAERGAASSDLPFVKASVEAPRTASARCPRLGCAQYRFATLAGALARESRCSARSLHLATGRASRPARRCRSAPPSIESSRRERKLPVTGHPSYRVRAMLTSLTGRPARLYSIERATNTSLLLKSSIWLAAYRPLNGEEAPSRGRGAAPRSRRDSFIKAHSPGGTAELFGPARIRLRGGQRGRSRVHPMLS